MSEDMMVGVPVELFQCYLRERMLPLFELVVDRLSIELEGNA